MFGFTWEPHHSNQEMGIHSDQTWKCRENDMTLVYAKMRPKKQVVFFHDAPQRLVGGTCRSMSFREHKGAMKCLWWLLLFLIWHGMAGDWPKKPPTDHGPLRWCAKKTSPLGCSNLQSSDSWKLRIQETLRNAAGLGATIWVGRRMENGGIKFAERSNFEKGTCNHWRILWWYRRLVSCWDGFLTSASLVPWRKWLAKGCEWNLLFCMDKGRTSLNQNPARCPLSHQFYQGSKNEALKFKMFKTYFFMCACPIFEHLVAWFI